MTIVNDNIKGILLKLRYNGNIICDYYSYVEGTQHNCSTSSPTQSVVSAFSISCPERAFIRFTFQRSCIWTS